MPETIITKRCDTCKQIKPPSDFHKHRGKDDGFQTVCKKCQKAYANHRAQTEEGKIVRRHYQQSTKYKVNRRKYIKEYQQTAKNKASRRRYNSAHPNQIKARNAISYAITTEELHPPSNLQCYYCSTKAQQYHHWHGYEPNHWLDVVPVCIPCHRKQTL